MITCECGQSVLAKNLSRHKKSRAHSKHLGEEPKEKTKSEENIEIEIQEDDDGSEESNVSVVDYSDDDGNDFLNEFSNDKFEQEKTKDELADMKKETQLLKEKLKLDALKEKEAKKFKKEVHKETGEDDNDMFSKEGSEILGLERRTLLKKVQQYKFLFPKELKGFKVKKTATVDELKSYIIEMEAIVSLDGTEKFVLDGLYQAVAVVEGVSSMTQDWDISGLHLMLKNNMQFQQLAKMLFVKYNTFSKVAPEYQAVFIVLTSAYICKVGNSQRKKAMKTQS